MIEFYKELAKAVPVRDDRVEPDDDPPPLTKEQQELEDYWMAVAKAETEAERKGVDDDWRPKDG